MPATYEPIATTTLSSATNSVTFNSIAASWTDIRAVIVSSNVAGSNTIRMRFNSDTGTNYSNTLLEGDGSVAYSGGSSNGTLIPAGEDHTTPSLVTVDIFSYAGSTYKTCLCTQSMDRNGVGTVNRRVALWRSTSAITSITFSHSSDNWNVGSTFTLYGIKAA